APRAAEGAVDEDDSGHAASLNRRGNEHELARRAAMFPEPVRLRGLREREGALDVRTELAELDIPRDRLHPRAVGLDQDSHHAHRLAGTIAKRVDGGEGRHEHEEPAVP